MARMPREKWYDIVRDLDWELSYVDYEAVFPEWMSGPGKIPREAWAKWDEPYKVTYPEYVATQREKETGALRAQIDHALDVVRPVRGEKRGDRRARELFPGARRGAGPRRHGSHRRLTPP